MSALTTSTLGEQITSQIRDIEKFCLLLSGIVDLQQSELALLDAMGGVERWATATGQLGPKSLSQNRGEPATQRVLPAETQGNSARPERNSLQGMKTPLMKSATPTPKRTIMVLPPDGMLTVRNCKQFAAVGIADGKGKDITTVAKWSRRTNRSPSCRPRALSLRPG